MLESFWMKWFVFGIVFVFLGSNTALGINTFAPISYLPEIVSQQVKVVAQDVLVSFSVYGKSDVKNCQAMLSYDEAKFIYELFEKLQTKTINDSFTDETENLKTSFINLLDTKGLLPDGISNEEVIELLNPSFIHQLKQNKRLTSLLPSPKISSSKASSFFCSIASGGAGKTTPFVILPRPHAIILWKGTQLYDYAITTVSGINSGKGFIAVGNQNGMAIGFVGAGLSFGTPYGTIYGLTGYAMYASATAEYIEFFPPNNPPEIAAMYPLDGATYVPLSTSELEFSISDDDNDLMSYSVTTSPNIGGGNGNRKTSGTYTVPVSGLKSSTQYAWHVTVSDAKDTVESEFTFITEAIAPIISDVIPVDGDRYVPITQDHLSFYLRDPQNDLMSYTVETSPFIGSKNGSSVRNGAISVLISGLQATTVYRWYVNATDGKHSTSETFWFRTGPLMVFDPFKEGWQYRKLITVNHYMVVGNLKNFPVLISVTDTNLREKAQDDGDDIVFMNGPGIATRLYHDLEEFDGLTGRLIAWVNVSSLSSFVDTTLYMYYGNTGSDEQQCPEKTWSSQYQAVWHMNDANPVTIEDSTINTYTGTKMAPNEPHETVGKIGEGQEFDGTNDNIWINGYSVLSTGDKTISFWMKSDVNTNYQTILTNTFGGTDNDAGLELAVDMAGTNITLKIGNGPTTWNYLFLTKTLPDHTNYHYYVGRLSGSNLSIYLDGSLYGWTTITTGSEALPINNISIGRGHMSEPHCWWFDGRLDEIRMSNVVLNSSWIKTEYNNQNSPLTFIRIGPEEPHP